MNRVKGQHIRRPDNRTNRYRTAVGGYLPLVVADYAELQQFAEIFFQRKNLPDSPFVGEGLTRSLVGIVGALALSVDFPVREQIHAGCFVLRNVKSCSRLQVVAKVSR